MTKHKLRKLLLTSMTCLWVTGSSQSATFTSLIRGNSKNLRDGGSGRDTRTRSLIVDRKLSMERCLQDKVVAERSQIGVECVCKSKPDQGIVLVCSDQCAFCNTAQSVCGIKSTEALYSNENGSRIGIGLVFEYLKPGPIMANVLTQQDVLTAKFEYTEATPVILLGIEEVDCVEDEDTQELTSCDTCNVYLGGTKCESCKLVECEEDGSGIVAPVFNCTNIQADSVYDFCEDVKMEENNPFQAFLAEQFERCLPMEVLLPGQELTQDPMFGNNFGSRTKTEDMMGNEIPVERVIG